ncbi:MAG: aminotransferase class V-fold PLP-dependent enzyme [Oceanospirillaceae bacterium]
MNQPFSNIDPEGLREYSVVYTDRSLNHMSQSFQAVMKDISSTLKSVYNAHSTIIVPGSGTFGMEAVARQFANQQKCLILRNGWFSFRWTQILDMGNIATSTSVLKARPIDSSVQSPFEPAPIEEVVAAIKKEQPAIVFAPHVETSSGIILPDDYLKSVAQAAHSVGAIFVLDCIASGTIWVDMQDVGIDVLISAPQKGWSGSPCCALVMLNELARERIEQTQSTSFACDLKKWLQIMEAYEQGGHAYHATMPTDSLAKFARVMNETQAYGFEKLKIAQQQLGDKTRALLASKGINSVAAKGFEAPGVVVSYTTDGEVQNGKKFADLGMQIAAGVPLQCDEGDDFKTFRIGLFGLDKLYDVDSAVATFAETLSQVTAD